MPTTSPSTLVTPSNLGQTQTQFPNQFNQVNNSGFNPNVGNVGTQANQLSQPQPNFSVPRQIPGRYIGGGQINTFANP
jgi:hypothetical protein